MRSVSFLIKPASSSCNMRCRYCFYADEASKRSCGSMGIMDDDTAGAVIGAAYAEAGKGGSVSFAFQGGEPTLAGIGFFRRFVEKAKADKPEGVRLSFSIQTNGLLLNDDWIDLFIEEGFLVGISIDGLKDVHDAYRTDAGGKETWNRIRRNAEQLIRRGADVNALCVVTGQCARSPQKAYETLKKIGFRYMQFIACLDPVGGERGLMPWSLSPDDYGRFLCRLFDAWYRDWEKGDYHSIRLFDDYVHLMMGERGAGICATCGQCGGYLAVEADGSVYPCDFFALDEWKLGNIREQSLSSILESDTYLRFMDKGRIRPAECAECRWRALCNGGCKNDWYTSSDGEHNYYCGSFRTFFSHAEERLLSMARAEMIARRTM